MFDEYLEWAQSRGQALFYAVCLGGGTLLLALSFWLWWHYQYLNPQNVFWGAVNNNLIINGVTKQTKSTEAGLKKTENEQITLGANNLVKSVSTVESDQPKSTVVTEVLGTPSANFARYTKIEIDQKTQANTKPDFSPVINQWSKAEFGNGTSGAFASAIFDIVPFANLNGSQRKQILSAIKHENVYQIDFTKVAKERKNGRLYYIYDVAIPGDKYIAFLKQVDAAMGLNQLKELDASQGQGSAPIQVKITIDAVSHQLSSVNFSDTNRNISYSAWGATVQTHLPDKTISQDELQAKLNGILGGQ